MGGEYFTGNGVPEEFHKYFIKRYKMPRQPDEIREEIEKLKPQLDKLDKLEFELYNSCKWMSQYQSCLLLWRDKVRMEDLKC